MLPFIPATSSPSTSRSRRPAAACWLATKGRSCSSGARSPVSACARASSAPERACSTRKRSRCCRASPDRRDSGKDWRCGGNVFAHVAYARQVALKGEIIQDAFGRIGRVPLPAPPGVIGSPEQGYRMRARLHASGGRIGFFREGTHEICSAAATGQLRARDQRVDRRGAGNLRARARARRDRDRREHRRRRARRPPGTAREGPTRLRLRGSRTVGSLTGLSAQRVG